MSVLSSIGGLFSSEKEVETETPGPIDVLTLRSQLDTIRKLKAELRSEKMALRVKRGVYHGKRHPVLAPVGTHYGVLEEIKEDRIESAEKEAKLDKTIEDLNAKQAEIEAKLYGTPILVKKERPDTSEIDKTIRGLYAEKETWESRKRELCWEPAKSLPEEVRAQKAAMNQVVKKVSEIEGRIKELGDQRMALIRGVEA